MEAAVADYEIIETSPLRGTIPVTHVEWRDDLLWPEGCPYVKDTIWAQKDETRAETRVSSRIELVEAAGIEPAS